MRHRRATRKLSRNTSNRIALLRSLVTNLIIAERIVTTYAKAKEASSLADKLISLGKDNSITSRKTAISILGSKKWINKLFGELAPRFADRKGGYTRVLQLFPRKGDGAKMAILELTERKITETVKKSAKKTKEPKKAEVTKKDKKAPHSLTSVPPVTAKEKLKEEEKKEKRETKTEEKKLRKSFFKGLRRYFRGKSG
ncbi:MAG: 50S ribosomal protein L17 [Candidatus Omnitrophota bacterium]|nr:50S ribosomal protein L17 [Candidatus Omnitrophota bacterium]